MTKSKKQTAGKIVKIALKAAWISVIIALVLLLITVFFAKIQGQVPKVFGYSVIHILTGSMGDTVPEGSYILLKEVPAEEIQKGDIICFYSSDPAISGFPNTHRVTEEPIHTENGIEFVTRGDANVANDSYNAKGDRLIGKYVKTLKGLTAFTVMLEGGGMIVIIIALTSLSLAMIAYSLYVKSKSPEAENAEEDSRDKDGKIG